MESNFAWKSLYLVFGLQALLAWVVAAPLLAAVTSQQPWNALDAVGFALAAFGLLFETVADAQLASFRSFARNRGRVMDRGLWRFSRHPNYFGDCCAWWGIYLISLPSGAWWTACAPALMTLLLMRVSGVTLLESTIADRRPGYAEYKARTNAFFPGPPRARD